jgi:hypothetical protein
MMADIRLCGSDIRTQSICMIYYGQKIELICEDFVTFSGTGC